MEKPPHEIHLTLQECQDLGSNFYLPGDHQSTFKLKQPVFTFGMFLHLHLKIAISNGLKPTSY